MGARPSRTQPWGGHLRGERPQRNRPCGHLDLGLLVSKTERKSVLLCEPPLWCVAMAALTRSGSRCSQKHQGKQDVRWEGKESDQGATAVWTWGSSLQRPPCRACSDCPSQSWELGLYPQMHLPVGWSLGVLMPYLLLSPHTGTRPTPWPGRKKRTSQSSCRRP